jgi:hypothetical protein
MKGNHHNLYSSVDRRRFLKSSALATFSFFLSPHLRQLFSSNAAPVRFGLISDLHKDIIHDADLRLQTFFDGNGDSGPSRHCAEALFALVIIV